MAFSLAGSLITQTGTDTSLAGLAAIVGVVTRVEGAGTYIKTRYYLPASTSLTYDILSFDPRRECLIFGTGAPLLQAGSATSVLNIGVPITQFDGTYSHLSEAMIFTDNSGNAYQVNQGFKILRGTLNWHSGIIRLQSCSAIGGSDYRNGGVVGTLKGYIGPYAVMEMMAVPSGQTNESCQIQVACDPAFEINGLTIKGYLTAPPTVLVSLASATQYTKPFVFKLEGAGGITPQADARTTNFATFYGLQTNASPKGLNWFLGSLIRGVNQALGSAVVCTEHNVDVNHCQGYAELRNEVDATFKTVGNAAIPNLIVYCRDTNNLKRKTYNLNGVVINNTADKVYMASTDAAGNVKFSGNAGSVLLAAVVRNATGTVVSVDDFGLNEKDYRSLSGTKGTDDFRFYYWSYGYLPQDSVEILKSDKVAKFLTKTLLADSNVTLSEVAAVAKLASSFTVAGNTLTVTTNSTLDSIYDAMKAYKTRNVQAQVEYPSIGAQPVVGVGDQLVTTMSIVVNAGVTLSSGVKFKSLSASALTVAGIITGFEVVGNVTQVAPASLTNVSITGNLTYNTAANTSVTYTNSILGTVNNAGAGVITVKRVNSTLTPGTNVTGYAPTLLSFSLKGGRIRVLDHLGVEQFNQTTDGIFELPAAATGAWSYKVANYGSKPIEGTFAINGTTIAVTPAYIPDPVVSDTLTNVLSYTNLGNTQKVYDYYSYALTTTAGILLTKSVTLTASVLNLGGYTLGTGALGVTATVISINGVTVSGLDIVTTGNQNGVTPTYPQRITDSVATSTWVNTTLATGRIRLLDHLGTAQENTTADSIILLPKTSTGTWTYKIARYGSQPLFGSFNVDGIIKLIAPAYTPDMFVADTFANVQAYTSLETVQKIYDYYSLYLASAAGILVTKTVLLTSTKLDLAAFSIANSALGVSSNVIGINAAAISGLNVVTTATQSGVAPTYPQIITDATTTSTWLNLTLNGGRIRVLNDTGVEQFNQTTGGTILLPTSSAGTWTYKIVKYGSLPIVGNFGIDGIIKTITPAYIPDTQVFDSATNVASYTSLATVQKVYDYYSLYLTTAAGILVTRSVTLTATALNLDFYTLTNSALGVSGSAIGINSSAVAGVNITTTATVGSVVPTYPQKITDAVTTSTWLDVALNGGRICILDNVGAEFLNTTVSGTRLLPASSTGNWTYKIVKYGSLPIVGSFTVDGVVKIIAPSYIPDGSVVDLLTNVTAYTSLGTSQKVYDYYSYFLTTTAGVRVAKTVTLTGTTLDLGAYTLSNTPLGVAGTTISTNSPNVSGVNIVTTASISSVSPVYPQKITDSGSTSNWVNLTLTGGRIRILNQAGVEQFNTTADGGILLPAASVGTWTYKIVKYGSQPLFGAFNIDGTVKLIAPSYIPDTFVVASLAAVSAYVSLDTAQKVYDYYSYYLSTAAGASETKSVTLTASQLNLGAYALTNTTVGVSGVAIGINSATVSGVNIVTTAAQSGVVPTYPQKITDATATSNWINLTLSGGRIRILNHLGAEQFNRTTDGIILLPGASTGTWTYKIVKYGSQPSAGTFNIDGTLKIITASYIPDTLVVDTATNAGAYTSLETTQKIYDYYSLYLASAAGAATVKGVTLTASALDLGSFTIANSSLGVVGGVIGINSATTSGVKIVTTGTQGGVTPIYPQQITDSVGTTNWLKVTLTAGQVCRDSFSNLFSISSFTYLVPAAFTSAITISASRRGYKKQAVVIPYSTGLLAAQSFTLIPDASVVDVVSDLTAANLGTSQLIYDAFSQYQASSAGILDTYVPTKAPGAIDFLTKGFQLATTTDLGATPLRIKSTGLTADTYYSSQNFLQGTAALTNDVRIRALNLDSELVFSTDAVTFYSSDANRNADISVGATVTGGAYRFKFGSTVSGVVLSGAAYLRVAIGNVRFFADVVLVSGQTTLDLGVQGQLSVISSKLSDKPDRVEIAPTVWNAVATTYSTPGTLGALQSNASSDPWSVAINGALTAKQVLNSVNAGVTTVDSKVSLISPKVDAVDTKVTSVATKVDLIAPKIDATDGKVVALTTKVDGVDTKVSLISPKVDAVDVKIVAMNTAVNLIGPKVDGVDTKVSLIGPKVDALTTTLNATDVRVVAANTALSSLDGKVATLDTKVTASSAAIGTVDTKVTAANTALSSLDGKVVTSNAALAALTPKVDAIAPKIDATDLKVATVDAKVSLISPKVDLVAADLVLVSGKLDTTSAGVSAVNIKATVTNAKLDVIAPKVDTLLTKTDDVVSRVTASNVSLTAITPKIDLLGATLGTLTSLTGVIDIKVDAVTSSLVVLSSQVEATDVKLDTLTTTTNGLTPKLDALPARFTLVEDKVDATRALVVASDAKLNALDVRVQGLPAATTLSVWNATPSSPAVGTTGYQQSLIEQTGAAANPWSLPVDGAITAGQVLNITAAACAGLASGGGTNRIALRNLANTRDAVVMAVDVNGNRSTVVLNH